MRWLAGQTPNLDEARQAVERIIRDGHRAGEVIGRVRAMVKKAPERKDWLQINEVMLEVLMLARTEMQRSQIALETRLAEDLPPVFADRVQLQQVILNLLINAVEAMSAEGGGARELMIRSEKDSAEGVLVTVHDSGPGLDPENLDRLFAAFYTTKPQGMGMGLAISRSIIEAHGGRLWATNSVPRGAIFQFTLPREGESAA